MEGSWDGESKHCEGEEEIHQGSVQWGGSKHREDKEEGGVCNTLSRVRMAFTWG